MLFIDTTSFTFITQYFISNFFSPCQSLQQQNWRRPFNRAASLNQACFYFVSRILSLLIRFHRRHLSSLLYLVIFPRVDPFPQHVCVDPFSQHVCVDRQALTSRRGRGLRRASLRLFFVFSSRQLSTRRVERKKGKQAKENWRRRGSNPRPLAA